MTLAKLFDDLKKSKLDRYCAGWNTNSVEIHENTQRLGAILHEMCWALGIDLDEEIEK